MAPARCSACPAHDQRDFEFATQISICRSAASSPPRADEADEPIGDEAENGDGVAGQFALPRRPDDVEAAKAEVIAPRRGRRLGRGHDRVAAARLGRVAPALLGHADPDHPLRRLRPGRRCRATSCRWCCPRTSASTSPAIRSTAIRRWKHVACPNCGGEARRETDTLDTFVDSSLVFHPLRQPAGGPAVRPRRGRALAAGRAIYRRGRACDPAPALRPLLDPRAAADRPARHRRAVQGPVHAGHGDPRDLSRRPTAAGCRPDEVEAATAATGSSARPASRSTPGRVEKMSKSKKNTVDPEPIVDHYGADAVRWFMLSDSPPERDLEWTEGGIEGAGRFVQRLWRLATGAGRRAGRGRGARPQAPPDHRRGRRGDRGAAVQQGGRHALRAANAIEKARALGHRATRRSATLVRLVAPMAPHLAEEAWAALGESGLIADAAWPTPTRRCWSRTR